MERENKVAVIVDSGSSMRPEYETVQKLGITVVPLDIKFYEDAEYVPDLAFTPEEFYQRMRKSKQIPVTSGAIPGRIAEIYKKLANETDSVISIHITSELSVSWASAVRGKDQEGIPETLAIEVIDSRHLSLGTGFLALQAAWLSQKGANLEQIKEEVLAMIPQVQLRVVLETFENLKKGGRAKEVIEAHAASILHISPILGVREGKLAQMGMTRGVKKSRERMVEMVGDSGKLVRLGILHTNVPEKAEEVKEALSKKIYRGEIPVYDAGPVLGVHAGEGAVGVVFQKA